MSKPRMTLPIGIVFSLVITCLSCGLRPPTLLPTFEGPLKPKNEVATLYIYDGYLFFTVEEIDGKSLAEIRKMNVKIKSEYFALLPGEHSVKIGGRPGLHQSRVEIRDQNVIVEGKAIPVTMITLKVGMADYYSACFGEWTFNITVEAGHYYWISYIAEEIKQWAGGSFYKLYNVTPHIREGYWMGVSTDRDHVKTANQKIVSTLVDFKPSTTSSWEKK
jgi:hypothetical protein